MDEYDSKEKSREDSTNSIDKDKFFGILFSPFYLFVLCHRFYLITTDVRSESHYQKFASEQF